MKLDVNEIKDMMKANMDDMVKEEAKRQFVNWLNVKALPTVRDLADEYVDRLKAAAVAESGWCKYRDGIVLPLVIAFGLWLAEIVLRKVEEEA